MSNHYINALLGRNCYEELSTLFACTHNPSKEITESYASFSNMTHLFNREGKHLNDFANLHIGDGSTCRTGALFTFLSKSTNISVDPMINEERMNRWFGQYNVSSFGYMKARWEEVIPEINKTFELWENAENLNLIFVHSHVDTAEVMNKFPNWKYAYVNPCCMKDKQVLSIQYMREKNISCVVAGVDKYIMSPENMVYIYRNDKEKE